MKIIVAKYGISTEFLKNLVQTELEIHRIFSAEIEIPPKFSLLIPGKKGIISTEFCYTEFHYKYIIN